MLFQQSQSFGLVVKPFESTQINTQIAQMTDSRTIYLVRDTEDLKDKAVVLLEQDSETNSQDDQVFDGISCNC